MRNVIPARRFNKDFKRCLARGLNPDILQKIVDLLARDKPLPHACRPHKLSGSFAGNWECHLAPDWLLIYSLDDENNALNLERTGTHSDLFN